jgi:MFS family permease
LPPSHSKAARMHRLWNASLSRIGDRNIGLVYVAIFVLGLAYGASIALTALHLDNIAFSKHEIGLLAAAFASGIVALAIPAGALIRRFSAKRTLVACLLAYALCVTLFPFQSGMASVALVRFFDGASSVGIWVSCETILLARSNQANKAFVMSIYAVSMAIGYLLGALGAMGIYTLTASMPAAFVVAGGLALASAGLVLLRLEADPCENHATAAASSPAARATRGEPRLSSAGLLFQIKTSCFATFAYGYFQASVVLFLPLFLIESKGVRTEQTIAIPAIFALGMLLFSSYAGALGDRRGHLLVMRVLASIGCAMIAAFVLLDSFPLMCVAIFVAGASLASISPISLALQGHIAKASDYARGNGLYNVFYAAGMLLGPPISSLIFEQSGGEAMLIHLALLWAGFVVFSLIFAKDDPGVAQRIASAPEEPSLSA